MSHIVSGRRNAGEVQDSSGTGPDHARDGWAPQAIYIPSDGPWVDLSDQLAPDAFAGLDEALAEDVSHVDAQAFDAQGGETDDVEPGPLLSVRRAFVSRARQVLDRIAEEGTSRSD